MDIHALQSLEFDHLRELLVDRAVSAPGKKRASMVVPSSDITEVLARLDVVSEITSLEILRPIGEGPCIIDIGQIRIYVLLI